MENKLIEDLKSLPKGYKETLAFVRKRDGYKCRICGKKQAEGKRALDVHHLDEQHEGKDGAFRVNHEPEKMVTLCRKCHMNLPVVRQKMSLGRS